MLVNLLLIASGMFLSMVAGWLDSVYINRQIVGLVISLEYAVDRFRVVSRKLGTFMLASFVILKPSSLNSLRSSFFIFSMFLTDVCNIPRPSSLYNPKLCPKLLVIIFSKWASTNSHVSAPS